MFKRKEKIKLTAYAPSTGLVDLFPVVKSRRPSWFKHIKKDVSNNVKGCAGFIDLYADSVTIPAWQDIKITVHPNGNADINAPQEQWSGVAFAEQLDNQAPGVWPNHVAIKFISPWLMECNKDVHWTMIQPVWDQKAPCDYIIVPGSLEFKYYNKSNIFALFPITDQTKEYHIKAGEPLVMLVPKFGEEFDLDCKFISHDEAERILTKVWQFKPGSPYMRFRSFLRKQK